MKCKCKKIAGKQNQSYGSVINTILPKEKAKERESLLAQTLKNFIQIKAKALGHRKKPVEQVVSSGTPPQLHKFVSWYKVEAELLRI